MTQADLSIVQGDNYNAQVTVYNVDGTPANIAGYTAKAQIRRDVADNAPIVSAEIVCTVESPLIRLALSYSQTEALAGDYVWDLQLTSPSPQFHHVTIISGRVRATQEVTRSSALGARAA